MAEDYQKIMNELSSLKRQMADMFQVGTVHEVKGTKLRMSIGKDSKGKDILSPWLNTNNMRGGAREQRFYKKGQTLSMLCPNGDLTQGMITPYAPNKDFPTPEQADGSGQGEEILPAGRLPLEADQGRSRSVAATRTEAATAARRTGRRSAATEEGPHRRFVGQDEDAHEHEWWHHAPRRHRQPRRVAQGGREDSHQGAVGGGDTERRSVCRRRRSSCAIRSRTTTTNFQFNKEEG